MQGVATADRDELAVAELTELGADEIAPLAPAAVADRWEARRGALVLPHWRAVAREAAERSGRVWLPRIWPAYRIVTLLRRFEWGAHGFVLDGAATTSLTTVDISEMSEIVLVIGAGYGLDEEALAALARAGAARVRHGEQPPTSRRAATAATAALAARLGRV
jgi:RsmE family RNA methyltransferase